MESRAQWGRGKVAWLLSAVALCGSLAACSSTTGSGGGTGSNGKLGQSGSSSGVGSGSGSGSGGASGSSSGGTCEQPGATCSANGDCCGGEVCIADDSACHSTCGSNAECNSGCCAPVANESYSVCAAASYCSGPPGPSCASAGSSCASTGDCCQSGSGIPYGQVCLSDDNACHALCASSSECNSGCCIKLQGASDGVCGQFQSGYTCL